MASAARAFPTCLVLLAQRLSPTAFSPAPLLALLPHTCVSFQSLSRLEEKEKEVVSALRYFKTIVDKMAIDKKVLEMLPGSASKVLEAILPLVQNDPRGQHR